MKKSIIFTLVFLLVFQFIPTLEPTEVRAGSTTYDGGTYIVDSKQWETYKSAHHLDTSLPYSITVKNKTVYFNKELWEELSLVVYGDYRFVSTRDRDFKAGTQNPSGIPYYTNGDGVRGEYRYHGFDRSGNNVNNMYFVDDATGSTSLENRTWIYEPWDASSPANDSFERNIGSLSNYNLVALNSLYEDSPLVAKWINQSLTFDIEKTTDPFKNTDAVHYNNIESAPSGYASGSGTMFHQSNYTGKVWYQTFSVPKYDKEDTPIQADMPEMAVTKIAENGDVTFSIMVTGEIMDDAIIGDSIKESIYYHRGDIKKWNFTLTNNLTGDKLTAEGKGTNRNKEGYHIFTLTIPKSSYQGVANDDGEFSVEFSGTAIAVYSTGDTAQATVRKTKDVKGPIEEEIMAPPFDPEEEEPIIIEFSVSAARKMLDIDKFYLRLTETDVSQAVDRYVILNGRKLSATEESRFLSGQYTFPQVREDRVYSYSIVYTDIEGGKWYYRSYVIVYDSVPHAQVRVSGTQKVNRKIDITADTTVNVNYLESRSSIAISEFTVTTSDGEALYFGSDTNQLKEVLRKTEGNIDVHVTVANEYGSRSYEQHLYVAPDYDPDIISIIWNNVLTRDEPLDILTEGTSLDGDTVTDISYEIFYDTDQDGTPETGVYSGAWNGSTAYTSDKLGNYKIVFTATEEFGQATLSQYVTEADKRTKTLEREFFVENLIPMTKVYTDIEYNFPQLDVVFLTDESLPREENDYIREHNVDITNQFRANSMDANVDLWDLYTYEFTQTAYKELHTGRSYPPTTTEYDNNGYTGTLTRDGVRNYPYDVDKGGYQTFTSYKSATASHYNTVKTSGTLDPYRETSRSESSPAPSSKYVSSGGYSGYIPRTSTTRVSRSYSSNPNTNSWSDTSKWKANYSGTIKKTWTEWVSDWVTYNDYYGDYSGTVYKYVKQDYTQTYQTETNKYIVYVTSHNVNHLSDFNSVKDIVRDATVILIGDSSIQSQFADYDYFIPYTNDTTQLIDGIINITKEDNPISNGLAVLVNESFSLNYTDIDAEGDPIIADGFQYVHDPNYFDNPEGLENGTVSSYSDTAYTSVIRSSFSKPGKYTIFRRIKDEPAGFEELGGYSNLSTLELNVHRKPIAAATLDWDFDPVEGKYLTTWVDESYDPDFQYSDTNKGIVDRKIKYRKDTGPWIYEIPDHLEPGTYTLSYIVMDNYGIWSNPLIMNFTLDPAPAMQLLTAQLTTEDPHFHTSSIPATEHLKLYDVHTRYPYDTHLEISIYQGEQRKSSVKQIDFIEGTTGIQHNHDIYWQDSIYPVPSTLPDGDYSLRITAVGQGNKIASKDLLFTVHTPTNLEIYLTNEMDNVGTPYDIKATTSKYVEQVVVTMLKGTDYETLLHLGFENMIDDIKEWNKKIMIGSAIPEDEYLVEYQAKTTNGNIETKLAMFHLLNLQITGSVLHTDLWNQHRIKYNQAETGTTDSPRSYDVFFPGEKFILQADTKGDIASVSVTLLNSIYSTTLIETEQNLWQGELWNEEMMYWKTQQLTFRFTATSTTGIEKVYYVPINIENTPYWRPHTIY